MEIVKPSVTTSYVMAEVRWMRTSLICGETTNEAQCQRCVYNKDCWYLRLQEEKKASV